MGIGHAADMNNRLNRNREKLSSGRDRNAHIRQQYKDVLYRSGKLDIREISYEELEKIKAAVRLKMRKRKQTMVWLYIFAVALIAGLTVNFVSNLI